MIPIYENGLLFKDSNSYIISSGRPKCVVHMRLGDCRIVDTKYINDPRLQSILDDFKQKAPQGSLIYNILNSKNISQRAYKAEDYYNVLQRVKAAQDPFDLIILSDGCKALSKTLLKEIPLISELYDQEELQLFLDQSFFKVFDEFSPTLLVGENDDFLFQAVSQILNADILVCGTSSFPQAIRASLGRGGQLIYKLPNSKNLVDISHFYFSAGPDLIITS